MFWGPTPPKAQFLHAAFAALGASALLRAQALQESLRQHNEAPPLARLAMAAMWRFLVALSLVNLGSCLVLNEKAQGEVHAAPEDEMDAEAAEPAPEQEEMGALAQEADAEVQKEARFVFFSGWA